MKKEVIIFSYVYHPESFLVNELAVALKDNGFRVLVYTGIPNYPHGKFYPNYGLFSGPYKEDVDGIEIVRFPIIPRGTGFGMLALNYMSNLVSGCLCLYKIFKRGDVFFIFGTSPIFTAVPAILLSKFKRRKIYLWLQDLWPESLVSVGVIRKNGIPYTFLSFFVRKIYSNINHIFIQSMAFHEHLEKMRYTGNISYLPNWFSDSSFVNFSSKLKWISPKESKLRITFAGNIGHVQNLEVLLKAVSRFSEYDFEVCIVGDGSNRNRLEALAEEMSLKSIKFYGFRPKEDMSLLFSVSDLLYLGLSSESNLDAVVPSKLQAYLSSGKIIVGAIRGEAAKIITAANCGIVVNPDDIEGLALNLMKLLALNEDERAAIGKSGRDYYERYFTKKSVVAKVIELLREVE